MSEFQESMSKLRDMISRSNELVEIKKEAGKIAFKKGKQEGRVEGAVEELEILIALIENWTEDKGELKKILEKRLGELK